MKLLVGWIMKMNWKLKIYAVVGFEAERNGRYSKKKGGGELIRILSMV